MRAIIKSMQALMLLFLVLQVTAQNSKLDSIENGIKNAKSDTQRINRIIGKVSYLSNINLDSSIALGLKTLESARKIGYHRGELLIRTKLVSNYCFGGKFPLALEQIIYQERLVRPEDTLEVARLYSSKGLYYGIQSAHDSAIYWLQKAIPLSEAGGDKDLLVGIYGNLAISYQQQSNLAQALFYQQKALRLTEQMKDENNRALLLVNIGNTYAQLEDNARAKENFLEAIEIAKRKGLTNVELYSYTNLASQYTSEDKQQDVYHYSMKAVKLAAQIGDVAIEAASLAKAAVALSLLSRQEEGEKLARKAISLADSAGQPLPVSQAYAAMGTILKSKGEFKSAIPNYQKAIQVMNNTELYTILNAEIYKDISECYERSGAFDNALVNYKMGAKISDSVRQKDNIQRAIEMSMNYDFEKKKAIADAVQGKKDLATSRVKNRQMLMIAALGIIVLAVLVIAFIQFRNSKHKQRANLALQLEKEKVESTLTELKETQAHLVQSEKLASLGALTAGIAHEIQNPLNFVNNFSEVSVELIDEMTAEIAKGDMAEAALIAEDLKQNLQKINHHGKRADSIVKGMLQHSRASSGQAEATEINVLADEYLRLAYHGMRAKDKSFNATIHTDFDESIGAMKVVRQEIGRVILNLIDNAFYAVGSKSSQKIGASDGSEPYNPTVAVSTKRVDKRVEIKVRDNGSGIPQSIIDKIFQPFFTTKPTGEGTGLGLSLSYDIIKAHRGQLTVQTEPGTGTTFTINLPIG
jgi:two-component system, NtrC family, sensor kinase